MEALPPELLCMIARQFLPALCAMRATCNSFRQSIWDVQLRTEDTLVLSPEEVTLGTCELLATMPALERIILAQLGERLLNVVSAALDSNPPPTLSPSSSQTVEDPC